MLKVENLTFSYRKKLIFENLNFIANKGEIVSIMGLNGSGKTTLIKNIARILKYKGAIYIENKDLNDFSSNELAKRLSYLPQKSFAQKITVYDAILLGRKPFINLIPKKEDIKKVDEIIEFLHLENIKNSYCDEISGGELQKVLIGRALAQEPQILLLDEPINHLDIFNQHEVMNLIKKIVKNLNLIALIVLHDLNIALNYSDKFIFLKDKSIYSLDDVNKIDAQLIKKIFNISISIVKYNNKIFIVPD